MSGTSADLFYWNDWQGDPALRLCSLAAQGLWMRLLCIAAEAREKGVVMIGDRNPSENDVAKLAGCLPDEVRPLIEELERNNVFSRDRRGFIYSRRMVNAEKKRAASEKGGKKGGRTTHSRKRGIFSTQDPTQEATQGGTQDPMARARTRLGFSNTNTNTNTRKNSASDDAPKTAQEDDPSTGFDDFWKAFPRKVGKGQAIRAYRTAIQSVDAPRLIAGAKAYAAERRGEPERFTKHPATWLNGQCWEDTPSVETAPQNNQNASGRPGSFAEANDGYWRSKVSGFKRQGFWLHDWGAEPGEPGCAVPGYILEDFGFAARASDKSPGEKEKGSHVVD